MLTYPFVGEKVHDQLGLAADDPRRNALRVANPLSEEAPLMRTSVLSTLLEALRRNVSRGQRDVAVFELGLVTRPELPLRRGTGPRGADPPRRRDRCSRCWTRSRTSRRRVALALAGDARPCRLVGPGATGGLVRRGRGRARRRGGAGRRRWWSARTSTRPGTRAAAPGSPCRTARSWGTPASCTPRSLAALDLPERTCAAELDLDVLSRGQRHGRARTASVHLPGRATATSRSSSRRTSRPPRWRPPCARATGELLETLSLFDVYTGDQVGDEHRSLAYRMVFRAPDRTLTTEEVNALRDRAIASAAADHGRRPARGLR